VNSQQLAEAPGPLAGLGARPCLDCGQPTGRAAQARRCLPCRKISNRKRSPEALARQQAKQKVKRQAALQAKIKLCHGCGEPVPLRRGPRKWCADCRAKAALAAQKRYQATELYREAVKRYAATEKARAKYRRNQATRRALELSVPREPISQEAWDEIEAQPCMACLTSGPSTVEHVIPLTREGTAHALWNLAPLCLSCNTSKHTLLWDEWLVSGRPGVPARLTASGC